MVRPNGACGGGYSYVFYSEMYGITIKDTKSTDAPVRVSIRFILLSSLGYKGACDTVMQDVQKLMHIITDTIILRADVCVDVQAPLGFQWSHWKVVCCDG